MSNNIIDQALDSYAQHQRNRGEDTDEVSFVAGFMSCFGILTGRVPCGLPEDTPILQVFELMQKNLDDYRNRVFGVQQDN